MTTPTDTKFWQLLAFWRDSEPGAKREEAARAIDAHVQGLINPPRAPSCTPEQYRRFDAFREHTGDVVRAVAGHEYSATEHDTAYTTYWHAQCSCGEWAGGFASTVFARNAWREHLRGFQS